MDYGDIFFMEKLPNDDRIFGFGENIFEQKEHKQLIEDISSLIMSISQLSWEECRGDTLSFDELCVWFPKHYFELRGYNASTENKIPSGVVISIDKDNDVRMGIKGDITDRKSLATDCILRIESKSQECKLDMAMGYNDRIRFWKIDSYHHKDMEYNRDRFGIGSLPTAELVVIKDLITKVVQHKPKLKIYMQRYINNANRLFNGLPGRGF